MCHLRRTYAGIELLSCKKTEFHRSLTWSNVLVYGSGRSSQPSHRRYLDSGRSPNISQFPRCSLMRFYWARPQLRSDQKMNEVWPWRSSIDVRVWPACTPRAESCVRSLQTRPIVLQNNLDRNFGERRSDQGNCFVVLQTGPHIKNRRSAPDRTILHQNVKIRRRRSTSAPRSFFATPAVIGFQMCW